VTTTITPKFTQIVQGLRFPEGPVAMPDGSVVLVEIERQTLSRVTPDGRVHVIAKLGGGPNGAAMGPGGKIFVTNNGGFEWVERPGKLFPATQAKDYAGGRIQVVDPETGKFETLYDACEGRKLRGPNDLVFDRTGGFWFTDLGKTRDRDSDRGAVYYAKADGSAIKEAGSAFRPTSVRSTWSKRRRRAAGPSRCRRRARSRRRTARIAARRGAASSDSAAIRCSTRWRWMVTATCAWPR
jgi:sugar lactone lactonase YvrE